MVSVFHGGVIVTNMKNYPRLVRRIMANISLIPKQTTKKMAKIHLKKTNNVINTSRVSDSGIAALVSGIEFNDKLSNTIKILSLSEISAFFEQGVREHEVYPNMVSVYGSSVANWMANKGVEGPFMVGGPDSTLNKQDPLNFMFKGYDASWNLSGKIVDQEIRKI